MALAAVRALQELVLITAITPLPPWPVTISCPLCHRHHHHLCHHNHLPSPLSLGHQWNHGEVRAERGTSPEQRLPSGGSGGAEGPGCLPGSCCRPTHPMACTPRSAPGPRQGS